MERLRVSEDTDEELEETTSVRHATAVLERLGLIKILRASPNIAYLAGASEDAHLGQGGKEGYVFDIESISERWLTEIILPSLKLELHEKKEVRVKKRGTRPEFRIQVWDKSLVEIIRTIRNNPMIIRLWPKPQQRSWVRGFADAEGSATRNRDMQPQFSIYNQSLEKLEIIGEILQSDGIHFGLYLPKGRDVWQLYITGRDNLTRFLNADSGVSHPEKRSRLLLYLAE